MEWAGGVGGGRLSHLMAGHPAYEGSWGRPRQAHYLLQLVYVYGFSQGALKKRVTGSGGDSSRTMTHSPQLQVTVN